MLNIDEDSSSSIHTYEVLIWSWEINFTGDIPTISIGLKPTRLTFFTCKSEQLEFKKTNIPEIP